MPPARLLILLVAVLAAAGATVLAASQLAPALPGSLAGPVLGAAAALGVGARLWLLRSERR